MWNFESNVVCVVHCVVCLVVKNKFACVASKRIKRRPLVGLGRAVGRTILYVMCVLQKDINATQSYTEHYQTACLINPTFYFINAEFRVAKHMLSIFADT